MKLELFICILQGLSLIGGTMFMVFGLPWVLAVACAAAGHGPQVCGL